jgi:hypothetical protein
LRDDGTDHGHDQLVIHSKQFRRATLVGRWKQWPLLLAAARFLDGDDAHDNYAPKTHHMFSLDREPLRSAKFPLNVCVSVPIDANTTGYRVVQAIERVSRQSCQLYKRVDADKNDD